MSVINNLFIPCVDASYPAHDLIDAFYLSGIATVSEVDYEPYIDEDCLYNRQLVENGVFISYIKNKLSFYVK